MSSVSARLHSDYATYVFNDASLAREIGDLAEADALYQRALQIWTDGLGPTHAFVARGLDALAEVAALRGQLDRSRELYERALAIYRRELGPTHPQVAWMLTNLARTVVGSGQHRRSAFATSMRPSRSFRSQARPTTPTTSRACWSFAARCRCAPAT